MKPPSPRARRGIGRSARPGCRRSAHAPSPRFRRHRAGSPRIRAPPTRRGARRRLERRDEVGDVADDEDLARVGVEDRRRVGAAVAAGDDDRARRLAFGEFAPARLLAFVAVFAKAAVARQQIAEARSLVSPCPLQPLARDGQGWQARDTIAIWRAMNLPLPEPAPPTQARLDPRQGAGQPGLCRDQAADARPQPRHGVRGSGLPEHRRMLDQEARHGDDPWRHLHPRLRLLQRQDGMPRAVDLLEPEHTAAAAAALGLSISSSPRSTATICPTAGRASSSRSSRRCAARRPNTTIEILTPDFRNKSEAAVMAIVEAGPDVYNHNLETVPRLYPTIRPGRALLCLAATARERQAPGPAYLYQIGRDGRPWRAAARGSPGDGRHALGGDRFPHHGPISPADAAPCHGRGICHARRVQGLCRDRPRQGLPARRGEPADAVELSRRRRFPEDAGGARGATGAGRGLAMPRHSAKPSICPTRPNNCSSWSPTSRAMTNSCRGWSRCGCARRARPRRSPTSSSASTPSRSASPAA